jgi:hypothetical protein
MKTARSLQPHRFPWEELFFAAVIGLPAAGIALLIGMKVASDLSGGSYDTLILNDTIISGGGSPFTIGVFVVGTGFGVIAICAGVRLWKGWADWRARPN